MSQVVVDVSSRVLGPALEANMSEFYMALGGAPPGELYDGPDLIQVITGLGVYQRTGGLGLQPVRWNWAHI